MLSKSCSRFYKDFNLKYIRQYPNSFKAMNNKKAEIWKIVSEIFFPFSYP